MAALYNTPYPILELNHPTDDPHPTKTEREKIEPMQLKAEVLRMTLLDVVIIAHGHFWCLARERGNDSYRSPKHRGAA